VKPLLRLAVFDLDGTLKQAPSPWQYLHEHLGLWEQALVHKRLFQDRKIDAAQWARMDAALWAGTEVSTIEDLFRRDPYRPGARQVVAFLREHNVPTAIISSGLALHGELVARDLGIDRVWAIELVTRGGRLTGEVVLNLTEDSKKEPMCLVRREFGALPQECLAVGDGPADVDLFAQAGLSIAVCPLSESVRAAADVVLEDGDLHPIPTLVRDNFRIE
jgi:phosphoserine phosphatase